MYGMHIYGTKTLRFFKSFVVIKLPKPPFSLATIKVGLHGNVLSHALAHPSVSFSGRLQYLDNSHLSCRAGPFVELIPTVKSCCSKLASSLT